MSFERGIRNADTEAEDRGPDPRVVEANLTKDLAERMEAEWTCGFVYLDPLMPVSAVARAFEIFADRHRRGGRRFIIPILVSGVTGLPKVVFRTE